MMMKNMNKLSLAVVALSAAAMFSSCEKEVSPYFGDGKYVTLKVSTSNIETKASSAEVLETIDFSDQGVELYLTGVKTLNTSNPFGPSTKAGDPFTAENVDQFSIRMTNPSKDAHIDGMATLTKGADYWSMVYDNSTTPVEWYEDEGNTSFLAYYPYTNGGSLFSNELNTVKYSTENGQEDFIVAYASYDHRSQHDEYHTPVPYVELNFEHALAQVIFKIGKDAAKVSKVVIKNAVSEAELVYDNGSFTTNSKNTTDFDCEVNDGGTCSFFVAPTEFAKSDLILEFQMIDGVVLRTVELGATSWDAGFTYNYTLSKNPEYTVDIEITDNSAVTVRNISAPAVYLRAAVVANVFDAEDRIIAPSSDDFSVNQNWLEGEDGFYYYKYPVAGYESADPLLTLSKHDNVKVSSAVQAILYTGKSALSVWGTGVPTDSIEELN